MNDLMQHRGEFARAIANKKYELTDDGVLFPDQKVLVAGVMSDSLNGGPWGAGPNIIPTAALNLLLDQLVGGAVQVNPWYVGLFSGNVTPAATLTGANFASTMTEFTGYVGLNRMTYNEAVAVGGVVDNAASRATFVMTAGGTIYGGALLSAQAKGAAGASDKLLACARFASSRTVAIDDELAVKYTLSATST